MKTKLARELIPGDKVGSLGYRSEVIQVVRLRKSVYVTLRECEREHPSGVQWNSRMKNDQKVLVS